MFMNIIFRFIFIIYFLVNISCASASEEIEGVFSNLEVNSELVEGDIFKAKITILPLLSAIPSEFRKKLDGITFLEFFKIIDVESVSFSKNNNVVLEIFLTAILVKKFTKKEFYIWSYKGLNIPFEIRNLNTSNNVSKEQKYLIHDQDNGYVSKFKKLIYICLSIMILFLVFVGKKIYEKKQIKKDERNKEILIFNKWKELFTNAKSRKDFEFIIKNKGEWKIIRGEERTDLGAFVKEVSDNMYKKEWSQEYLDDVNELFSNCRDIFGEKWK